MTLVRALPDAGGRRRGGLRTVLTLLIGCLMLSTLLFVALALRLKTTQMMEVHTESFEDTAEMRERIERMQGQVAHLAKQIDGLQPSICQSIADVIPDCGLIVATSPPRRRGDAESTPVWRAPKTR